MLVIPAWKVNMVLEARAVLCVSPMGLLPDTQNCGLRMRQKRRERFPRHCGLAIPHACQVR